jgi:ABC-2 type transport system permease protein
MSEAAKPRLRPKVTRRPPAARPRTEAVDVDEHLPSSGWRVVAAKELGDHVLSVRFIVLLIVLGLAAAIPLYFAAGQIRDAAQNVSGAAAAFIYLFALSAEEIQNQSVFTFISIVAPLLGLAFAFDAINGERSEGTLPRLLSQPIYRDDVINGKFAAGMAVIGLVIVTVIVLIASFGLLRLGIVPHPQELFRLLIWVGATFLYVALWLAFGLLLSVLIRRAATTALIGFGVWLVLTIFGGLITQFLGGFLAPAATASGESILRSIHLQELVQRLLPSTIYNEISLVLLRPDVTELGTPATIDQIQQAQQRIPSLLSLDQSLLLIWPHVVALVALTVVCFAGAYVAFMRQEVRA